MATTVHRHVAALALSATLGTGSAAIAQQDDVWSRPVLSFMGVPGIVDMPTAHPMPDGNLGITIGRFGQTQRNTLYFQITPRLSGTFRYAIFYDLGGDNNIPNLYDRSFDLRYNLLDETPTRPAVTIGLQDLWGTGVYSSEYITATKTFGRLRATAGLGWGRLATNGGFDNPLGVFGDRFKTRPRQGELGNENETGELRIAQWFRGDAAIFGGLQYAVSDRLMLAAEYSSDDYRFESTAKEPLDYRSPLNFGVTYRSRWGVDLSAAWLHGSTFGVQLSYRFDPKQPNRFPGGLDRGPLPVAGRAPGSTADLGWRLDESRPASLRQSTQALLAADGMMLEAMDVTTGTATIRLRIGTQTVASQAIGRAARILTRTLPASIERFVIVPVTGTGLPASQITLTRSDLEELEFAPDGAWQSFARAQISDSVPVDRTLAYPGGTFPKVDWALAPYLNATYFDPRSPVRLDYGLELTARYEPTPGVVVSGAVQGRLNGSTEDLPESNSVIRKVRTDGNLYAREGQVALTTLTAARYFRPGPNLYGRVTAGYLERMYGGISGELLWKPVDSRLALGVELNYARQRDFDQRFGFQDYGVATGHASAYYESTNGFDYQLDVGRYLAGDWGATLGIDRRFGNGIKVGLFATLTDVPFSEFGEGSFDKGIRFDIPLSVLTGRPSDRGITRTIRPVQRDGGARLAVDGRLYQSVRDFHRPGLQEQWGRFWR